MLCCLAWQTVFPFSRTKFQSKSVLWFESFQAQVIIFCCLLCVDRVCRFKPVRFHVFLNQRARITDLYSQLCVCVCVCVWGGGG